MSAKKPESNKQTTITVGNISDVSGTVNVVGGNITTHHTTSGLSAAEIEQLFSQLYTAVDERPATPETNKEDIKSEVKEIQSTVTQAAQKNEQIDEKSLSRRFRNIARMAPDILDVVVATLGNPLAGLGVAVKNIADKAKAETSTS